MSSQNQNKRVQCHVCLKIKRSDHLKRHVDTMHADMEKPVSDFKWIDAADVNVASIPDDGEHGYFFEVDLVYPKELHQLHNDYPLAPERVQVTRDMLSPFQQQFPKTSEYEKLIPKSARQVKIHLTN